MANGGDAFYITTPAPDVADRRPAVGQAAANRAAAFAATLSAVETSFLDSAGTRTAVCLYDFLFIAGGRDANGIEADRYCGNALNPAPLPFAAAGSAGALTGPALGGSATSIQVCSKFPAGFHLYVSLEFSNADYWDSSGQTVQDYLQNRRNRSCSCCECAYRLCYCDGRYGQHWILP